MAIKNTDNKFGIVSKIFHWSMALIIIGLLGVGLFMTEEPKTFELYSWHKSFGVTALLLGGLRLIWTLINPSPKTLSDKKIEHYAAKAMHIFLYISIFGMPLSGWAMSSSGGHAVKFFGLFTLPPLVEKDKEFGSLMGDIHYYLGYVLIAALVLHVIAAVKHHIIDKDDTLRRMLPMFVVILLLSMSNTAFAAPANWTMLPEQSHITFQGKQMGASFDGVFKTFTTDIAFDADDLEHSHVTAQIDITSLDTKSSERDTKLRSDDWFNSISFPTALFKSTEFKHIKDNLFEAKGTLSIRDTTVPVTLPFTLIQDKDTAIITSNLELDRTALQLGQGDWADTSIIAQMVPVSIKITAIR